VKLGESAAAKAKAVSGRDRRKDHFILTAEECARVVEHTEIQEL